MMEGEARSYLISLLRETGLAAPRMGVVLGSGLGGATPQLEGTCEVDCREVPGWPACSVPGHAGKLCCGSYGGTVVMVQQGRPHYYEGLDMGAVTFPVVIMAAMGIEKVFMANAAGALNPVYERGCLMLVRDHINLMGSNPLRGMRDGEGNPAFLDVSSLYDEPSGDALMENGKARGWPMEGGVLVAVSGPTYETGTELRYMRLVGGDAVSMSMVPEALVAHYLGISVTAVSVITNVWDLRRPHATSHREVLDTAAEAAPILRDVITSWLDL
ncbi:MAG: purine-nucleoside phosphorylase [Actinobacteria bacterium]|jgi:purine-nucleoside phosphorylase|nr:MAG: purine-nucleoside phosphorylase [Actinomycetota bacterium]